MELTIEQAFQQGLDVHKKGNLQEAERLYRLILQSQPLHPHANHNLGLIAVSVNQAREALPLFKIALEVNSKIEQFWLSYITALMTQKQFEEVSIVFQKAKAEGLSGDKIHTLEKQFLLLIQDVNNCGPSETEKNQLTQYYDNGQYDDAEKLALSITQQFPKHAFGWKVLGAVLGVTGRQSEAINVNQVAVTLSPLDAEAHFNLGNMFRELCRLDEAEISYVRAIAVNPGYIEAHNNLGITLKELYRLDEAEVIYNKAITLNPSYPEAHNNLGITLQDLGRVDEAEVSYKQAITLKPEFSEALFNLGSLLRELTRFDEAEAILRQVLTLKPNYAAAHNSLGIIFKQRFMLDEAEVSYRQAIMSKPDYAEAHKNLLGCLYLLGKQSPFFDQLDHLIEQGKVSSVIGSFTCRAALKYGEERSNPFCKDPLKYVVQTNLNTQIDFKKIVVEKLRTILDEDRISNRSQSLLINGHQTSGNLFEIEDGFTKEIQKVIRLEIERYRINFKNSEEGLITNWPTEYRLSGWLISMKSGGELQPHIHEKGWLSGSIYVNVPPNLEANSGKLVVSLGEEKDVTGTRRNSLQTIDVVTGDLVLFPASLTHYTIPFESEEERIVLAFDVVPS